MRVPQVNTIPCSECKEVHPEPTFCEACKRCLYASVKKQIPDPNWSIVECECGHRQVWD